MKRYIHRLADRRTTDRDGRIVRIGRDIDRWSRDLYERLMGVVASKNPLYRSATAVDMMLMGVLEDLAGILGTGLGGMAEWGYTSAGMVLARSVPPKVWAARLSTPRPRARHAMEGKLLEYAIDPHAILPNASVVVSMEFGTPSAAFVRRAVRGGIGGVDAMSRIKTVAAPDLFRLRRAITLSMSGTGLDDDASAVASLSKEIRQLVGNDPGKSTGMNYRAKRIARTEGIRIAEESQRAAWAESKDMFDGMWTERGGHKPCEICEPFDHILYRDDGTGQYVNDAGELLPMFPAHPNCLCYTVPELKADLTAGLPDANYGDWYDQSRQRAAGELAAVGR